MPSILPLAGKGVLRPVVEEGGTDTLRAMRILVTGGAGFVGSRLVARMLSEGHSVEVLDDLSTGRREVVPAGARLTVGDCRSAALVETCVARADRIFHLAAAVGVALVAADPAGTWSRNLLGTATVLDGAAARQVPVLLASSSEVYGPGRAVPLQEEDAASIRPTGRREVYGLSKAAGEAYALALHRTRGLPVVVARLFNVVGAGQSDRYGMVLARFVAAARRGEPLEILGDGSQRRCFLHVADAVEALALLAEAPGARGLVVNVGSDEEASILDLARLVLSLAGGGGIRHRPFAERYGEGFADFERRVPDLSRLVALTGFRRRRTLRDAVADALAEAPR
jgi:UDP-glucose 4-epimerase